MKAAATAPLVTPRVEEKKERSAEEEQSPVKVAAEEKKDAKDAKDNLEDDVDETGPLSGGGGEKKNNESGKSKSGKEKRRGRIEEEARKDVCPKVVLCAQGGPCHAQSCAGLSLTARESKA